ncbi:MAG: hypothetical protein ACJAYH_001814 [Celeribacter sp.]|jgi:hypothetical protein
MSRAESEEMISDTGDSGLKAVMEWMSARQARPCLSVREGMGLIAQIKGLPLSKPKMLVGPGRSRLSPYHLKSENGLDNWSEETTALPAFASLQVSDLQAVS